MSRSSTTNSTIHSAPYTATFANGSASARS
jgi:hypothetical protein